jgi:hypothetical protein
MGSTHRGDTARLRVQRSAPAGAAKVEEPRGSAERRADGRKETEDLRIAAAAANGWRGARRGGAAAAAAATGGHGADAMGIGRPRPEDRRARKRGWLSYFSRVF